MMNYRVLLLFCLLISRIGHSQNTISDAFSIDFNTQISRTSFVGLQANYYLSASKSAYGRSNYGVFGGVNFNGSWITGIKAHGSYYIYSFGAEIGYSNNQIQNQGAFYVRPEVGFNFLLGSIYYGYNFYDHSKMYTSFGKHTITISIFLFEFNELTKWRMSDFKSWHNIFGNKKERLSP